jgi:type II secretory pathway pseudopilin PulG
MKNKNNKGMVLGLVIIVMAVLSILGLSLITLAVSNTKVIAYQNKTKQAYYLARSGADSVATYLIANPKDDVMLLSKTSEDNLHFTNGTFKVSVISLDANTMRITGKGNVSGTEKSTSAVISRQTVGELLDKAIYTNSDLDITGMVVEGDIQSGGNINYKTNGHGAYDTANYSAVSNTPKYIDTVLPPSGTTPLYTPQDLVVSGNVQISSSCKLNSIEINQNKTLEIKADDKVVDIVVNNLTAKGNITITATGTGRVNLFVVNKFEVQTKGHINNNDPKNLYIYMQEGSVFHMQAGIVVKAYIIAPDADAVIQSEKSTIYGALIANKLTKNGVNGPNGSVVFVPQENSTEIDENLKAYKIIRWEE